ncbi:MAG: FecR domain-containing protein [Pseudolabrys sp.]
MCNRSWIYVLPLTVLFALLATTSQAQEAIGKAASVRPQAEGSHAGPLSGGSNVYSKETVRTGDSGQADLQFHDRSNLTVGPKSSVRLDKFVYDPNKSGGAVAIQATRGTFRFVTGSQGGSYQIKSPYGTLGIRG